MTQAAIPTAATPARKSITPRLKIFGAIAFGFCAVGYLGFLLVVLAIKAKTITMGTGIALASIFAVMGEGGLWVGAACLGLGLYTRRRESIARLRAKAGQWFGKQG